MGVMCSFRDRFRLEVTCADKAAAIGGGIELGESVFGVQNILIDHKTGALGACRRIGSGTQSEALQGSKLAKELINGILGEVIGECHVENSRDIVLELCILLLNSSHGECRSGGRVRKVPKLCREYDGR